MRPFSLIPEKAFALLTPETVTPAVLYLVSEEAPNRTILCAGAGAYAVAKIVETDGAWRPPGEQTPEGLAAHWAYKQGDRPDGQVAWLRDLIEIVDAAHDADTLITHMRRAELRH